jgi:hypothetical protein
MNICRVTQRKPPKPGQWEKWIGSVLWIFIFLTHQICYFLESLVELFTSFPKGPRSSKSESRVKSYDQNKHRFLTNTINRLIRSDIKVASNQSVINNSWSIALIVWVGQCHEDLTESIGEPGMKVNGSGLTIWFGQCHEELTESIGESGMKVNVSTLTVWFSQARKPSPNKSVMCRGARKSAAQRLAEVETTDWFGGTPPVSTDSSRWYAECCNEFATASFFGSGYLYTMSRPFEVWLSSVKVLACVIHIS